MAGRTNQVLQLRCAVQCYAWGKIGTSSTVAQLAQNNPSFQLDPEKPYAELWMGTHPNGPSKLVLSCSNETETSLSEWLYSNSKALGDKVLEKFDGKLPFLFKVLSVNKSLSIQAHPNKCHAEQLHSERPDIYRDPNHKPEMAIALTQFEGLCGFRPVHEIVNFLKTIPEFASVVGEVAAKSLIESSKEEDTRQALKSCFSSLMKSEKDKVSRGLNELLNRITSRKNANEEVSDCLGDLFLRLHSQFPGDVGCFCIYFLNHVVLAPGEAMFLGPNLPHAYLSGDCMECMACSDNVVRAGLTPKYKDVDTLCEMLQYKPSTAKENIFPSYQDPKDPYVSVFNPPVTDFTVSRIQLPDSCSNYTIAPVDGPSILITIRGDGRTSNLTENIKLSPGCVLFIPANQSVEINNGSGHLLMFRAYCTLE